MRINSSKTKNDNTVVNIYYFVMEDTVEPKKRKTIDSSEEEVTLDQGAGEPDLDEERKTCVENDVVRKKSRARRENKAMIKELEERVDLCKAEGQRHAFEKAKAIENFEKMTKTCETLENRLKALSVRQCSYCEKGDSKFICTLSKCSNFICKTHVSATPCFYQPHGCTKAWIPLCAEHKKTKFVCPMCHETKCRQCGQTTDDAVNRLFTCTAPNCKSRIHQNCGVKIDQCRVHGTMIAWCCQHNDKKCDKCTVDPI